MPEGWSADVEAGQVVVRFRSARERHDRRLTAEEALALADELGVGYLAVSGVLGVGDSAAVRAALRDYTPRSVPALGTDAYAQQVDEVSGERDAGYAQPAVEFGAESVENPTAAEREPSTSADRGYQVRDYRDGDYLDGAAGRPRIEASVPECDWPVVLAVKYAGGWLVVVDPTVAEVAGLGSADLTGLDATDAGHALARVYLLAALYVKAARQHHRSRRPGSKGGDQ